MGVKNTILKHTTAWERTEIAYRHGVNFSELLDQDTNHSAMQELIKISMKRIDEEIEELEGDREIVKRVGRTCDVCGGKNMVEFPMMGKNCLDCNPIKEE